MLVPVLISVTVIVFVTAVLFIIKNLQVKRAKEVLNRFQGRRLLRATSSANFFGQESRGISQVRGNGVLLITEDELYYEMWLPKREVRISLTSVLSIETPKWFLGKTKSHPLLKVNFQNEKGQKDSVAWLVGNVNEWKEVLEGIIKVKK